MIEIKTPQTAVEWEAYYDLRYRILREPLGKERGTERNEGDAQAVHFALFEDGKIRAVARLDRVNNELCQARFVAVEISCQGKGYGKLIMQELEQTAQATGYRELLLHARDYALPFYEKLGYTLIGPSYKLFDTLQHFEMRKKLR